MVSEVSIVGSASDRGAERRRPPGYTVSGRGEPGEEFPNTLSDRRSVAGPAGRQPILDDAAEPGRPEFQRAEIVDGNS